MTDFNLKAMRKAMAGSSKGGDYLTGQYVSDCHPAEQKHNNNLARIAPDMAVEIERLTALVDVDGDAMTVAYLKGHADGKTAPQTEMENLRETNMALVTALATAREDALNEAAEVCVREYLAEQESISTRMYPIKPDLGHIADEIKSLAQKENSYGL